MELFGSDWPPTCVKYVANTFLDAEGPCPSGCVEVVVEHVDSVGDDVECVECVDDDVVVLLLMMMILLVM